MKKIIIGAIVLILAAAALLAYFAMQGPDLTAYEHLKEPAISTRPPQKMIVVEAKGDPNAIAGEVFETLYDLYYRTEGVPTWPLPAPRARWPASPDQPMAEWIGIYGLPVPDSVTALPEHTAVPGLAVSLTTWTYGDVAELLYTGPYDEEQPALQRLRDYIDESGYAFVGAHEEEYLKGPGMFFRGNPENYVTILRYEIRSKAEASAVDEGVTDGADDENGEDDAGEDETGEDEVEVKETEVE
jgi:hypothetical protein